VAFQEQGQEGPLYVACILEQKVLENSLKLDGEYLGNEKLCSILTHYLCVAVWNISNFFRIKGRST
jgi:hypothetical protein